MLLALLIAYGAFSLALFVVLAGVICPALGGFYGLRDVGRVLTVSLLWLPILVVLAVSTALAPRRGGAMP